MLLSDSFPSLPRAAQRSADAGLLERLAERVAEELPGVELDPSKWLCFAALREPRADAAIVLRCNLAPLGCFRSVVKVVSFLQVLQQRAQPLPGTRGAGSSSSSSASQTAAIEEVLQSFGLEYRLADSADEALVQRWKRKQAAPGDDHEADAADAGRRSSHRDQSRPPQQPSAATSAAAGAAAKAANAANAAVLGRGLDQAQDERKRTRQQQQQQEGEAGEEQHLQPKKQKVGDLNELSLGKNWSSCEQQMQPPRLTAPREPARAGSGSITGSTSAGTKAAAAGAAPSGRRRKTGSSLRAVEELEQQLRWQQRWAPKPLRASATSRATAAPASPAAARKAAMAAAEARRKKAAAESGAAGAAASAGVGAGVSSSSGGTARQRKRAAAAAVVAAASARAAAAAQAAKRPRLAQQQQAAAARRSAAAAGGGTQLQDSSRLPDGRLPSPQALQQLAAQVSAELPGAVLGPGWQVYPALQGGSSSVAPKKDVCICHPDLPQGYFRSAKSVVTFLAAAVAQMDARGISRKDTAVPGLAVLPAPAARAAARGAAAKPAQQQKPSSSGRLTRQQRGSSAAAGTSAAAAAAAEAAAAKAPLPPAALRAALKAASGGFVFKGISSISSKRGGRAASVASLHPADRELALREGRSWVHPPIDATHGRPKKGPVLVLAMFFANAEVADASHEGLAQHRDRARLLELQQGGGYTAHSFDRDHREDEAEGGQHVRGNFNSLRGARDVAARFPGVKFKAIFLDYFRVPSGYAASLYKPQLFTQFIPELVRAGAVSPGVPIYIPNNEALLHQLATASAFSCYSGFVAVPAARYPLYTATGRAEASGKLGGEYNNSSEVRELVEGSEFVVVRCTGVAAPAAAAAAAAAASESDALGSSSGLEAAAAGPAGQAAGGSSSGPRAAGRAEAGAAGGSSGLARLQAGRTRRGRPPLATGRADV